ncbi:hypothetical protein DENSPDRAFT_845010 [Dentipellis sp. KUC8613]|nr:hypothetical protein DENSPDRAFT_845010 [Dentipellis sp. KUC8613]
MATRPSGLLERECADVEDLIIPMTDRLPPEILERVFLHCVADTPVAIADVRDHRWCFAGTKVPDWIRITYVCRRWRRIAIGYPMLWTHVMGLLSMKWISTFFQRSEPFPLDIDIELESWVEDKNLLRLLQGELHRIRQLYVYYRGVVYYSHFDHVSVSLDTLISCSVAQTPMPMLESFAIDVTSLPFLGFDFPVATFEHNAPCLRELSFCRNIRLGDSSALNALLHVHYHMRCSPEDVASIGATAPNLQTLELGCFFVDKVTEPEPPCLSSLRWLKVCFWDCSLLHLLSVFYMAPNVEEIHIPKCSKEERGALLQQCGIIPSSLRELVISLNAMTQAQALSTIPLLSSVHLRLQVDFGSCGNHAFGELADHLADHLHRRVSAVPDATDLAIRGLALRRDKKTIALRCFRRPDPDDADATVLTISYFAIATKPSLFGAHSLCNTLDLSNVHIAHIQIQPSPQDAIPDTNHSDWMPVLLCMPELRDLRLEQCAVAEVLLDVFHFAQRRRETEDKESQQGMTWLKYALPSLERLVLERPLTADPFPLHPSWIFGLLSRLLGDDAKKQAKIRQQHMVAVQRKRKGKEEKKNMEKGKEPNKETAGQGSESKVVDVAPLLTSCSLDEVVLIGCGLAPEDVKALEMDVRRVVVIHSS